MTTGIHFMTRAPNSYLKSKKVDIIKTKLHLSKRKNGNDYADNNKSEHASIKKNKMPKLIIKHNNGEKLKLLRRNEHYVIHIAMWQLAIDILVKKRISFVMRCKRGAIKHECKNKFHLKRDKSINLNKNHKLGKYTMTMNIYSAKSNMRLTIVQIKNAFTIGKPTMKSIAMASLSSPCQSFPEALTPKTTFHGH